MPRNILDLLGKRETAARAVEVVVARHDLKSEILAWGDGPIPPGSVLVISLAEIYGRMKLTEAIPFLIENASVDITMDIRTFTRRIDLQVERLPAVRALIAIGTPAAQEIVAVFDGRSKHKLGGFEHRQSLLLALSRMPRTPEVESYLRRLTWEFEIGLAIIEDGRRTVRP